MNTGNLQRRWSETRPSAYDKENRLVRMDITEESRMVTNGEDEQRVEGYSYLEVQIDPLIEYGHIKSQLIESGFAQKDEFGLLMNAVDGLLQAASGASSWDEFKESIDTVDIKAFGYFCEFRAMCAAAAKNVMNRYR